MNRLFLSLHWLNLDTAIGAVITSLFIADYLETYIPIVAAITLLLAVLAIYNFDHLMDARRVTSVAKSARHRFYQQHQKALSIYQLFLMLGLITIIWYLPEDILRAGLVLALVTGIYFILLFFVFPKRFLFKEIMIASVYSVALFLAPIYSSHGFETNIIWILLWFEILLLAVSNTLIFAWYDHEIDLDEGHTSLAGSLGKSIIYWMVVGLLICLLLIVILQLLIASIFVHQIIILLMTSMLFYSLLANRTLQKHERFRFVGDAVFIIPIIVLLV